MSELPTPEEKAHDVLAAEEFPMPASDPALHHGPLHVPDDPTGIVEPHDVLAAEEFPVPATGPHGSPERSGPRGTGPRRLGMIAAAGILALLMIRALRRR